MKALINIDYTNDFVAEDGTLTCGKPGQDIHDKILSLTKEFYEAGEFVAYHPETGLFPPHNIEGTDGRLLYGDLEGYYQEIKNAKTVYYTDKRRYSAFNGTDLETKLRERDITEVHLVGVCTDICVLHTAVDAYNKGFSIVVYQDAVASFDQAGHEWALRHFKNTLGAKVV